MGLALLFFSASEWLPWIKSWKSRRIMAMSSVYLEDSIKDSFLKFSLNKAHLAHLLDPKVSKVKESHTGKFIREIIGNGSMKKTA